MRLKFHRLVYLLCLGGFLTTSCIAGAEEQNSPDGRLSLINRAAPKKSFSSFGRRTNKQPEVIAEERKDWWAETKQRLQHMKVSDETEAARVKYYQSGLVIYWFDEEALLRFENEEWIYIVTHSGHLSDGVGSAILAVDNSGNLYANQAHVCDGISISTQKGQELRYLSDFLKKPVDDNSWEKLDQ